MEKKLVLCDTNILIEFYKNNQDIIKLLKEIGQAQIALSVVTVGELIYGALNKNELRIIQKDISHLKVIHINEQVSKKFTELIGQYSLSHNLDLPDALIAATAITHDIELFTLNKKHFRYIEELKLWDE